jgi:hypothetical protein
MTESLISGPIDDLYPLKPYYYTCSTKHAGSKKIPTDEDGVEISNGKFTTADNFWLLSNIRHPR